jgi:rhamnosyltransferase
MAEIHQHLSEVCAVVVAYHPSHAQLDALIGSLKGQVGRVVVVDNTDRLEGRWHPAPGLEHFVHLIRLDDNLGVGCAQNVGARSAVAGGARYVLLLDQDSLPTPGMLDQLLRGLLLTQVNDVYPPLVAGPVLVDQVTSERSDFLPSDDVACCSDSSLSVVATRLTVASGMLIDVRAFDLVGYMREDYFIDWIDIEWVMRLHQMGYFSVGVRGAELKHNEGEVLRSIWFIPNKKIPYHQPFRNYYRVRNQLFIFRDLAVPFSYKLRRVLGLIKYLIYFSFFADRRLARLRFMLLGFWHGLLDRRGRL